MQWSIILPLILAFTCCMESCAGARSLASGTKAQPSFVFTRPSSPTRVLYKSVPASSSLSAASVDSTRLTYSVADTANATAAESLLERLRGSENVEWAALDEALVATRVLASTSPVTPDDPDYGQQWGLAAIGAPAAWELGVGAANKQAAVTVCVVDSGIDYTHVDLAENMAAVLGISVLSGESSPMDDLFHGTHVAGIVGAVGSNALDVTGVVWRNVSLLACRFIDSSGSGTTSGAVDCIDYCLSQGANIIQNSWGGSGLPNSAMGAAIAAAAAADALFVVSAGNNGLDVDDTVQYPASYAPDYPNVLAVASVGSSGALSAFSNYGEGTVALAAPGENILSTVPNNGTHVYSGTSMAAPFVSGAAALVLSVAAPAVRLTATQVKDILLSTAEMTDALQGKVSAGMLRLDRALEQAVALAAAAPSQ